MTKRLHFLLAAFLVVSVAGCLGNTSEPVETSATYDAFGESITPEGAVPITAVAAESDRYIGQTVKIEGTVTEVCQNAGCWLTMGVVDGRVLRVDVPRDSAGVYVYTFPKDIAGRRVVLAGLLSRGEDAPHEHGDMEDHADMEDEHADQAGDEAMTESHDEAEADAMVAELALVANGALVERVRTSD